MHMYAPAYQTHTCLYVCRGLGMEVCTTLGMLNPDQASQLREAGLTAYNHNLDTSPEYYQKVTTTRKYEVRWGGGRG